MMTVAGGASQMRGSGFFRDKQLFRGHRPTGLSRNSAGIRTINGQKTDQAVRKQYG